MLVGALAETPVARVALSMRAWDRREIFAGRWEYDPIVLARQVCEWSALGAVVHAADGEPVAVVNAAWSTPAVLSVGMFATDRWGEVARPASRWCATTFRSLLVGSGARRAECWSMVGHLEAHAWLRWLGFRPGCEAVRGRGGERFVLFGCEVG
jgi:hypothetical protein